MKQIYSLLIITILMSSLTLAENNLPENMKNIKKATPEELKSLQGDYKVSVMKSIPSAKNNQNSMLLAKDTITDCYDRATSFTMYGITISNQTYPLVGTNPLFYFVGEMYNLNADQLNNYKLTGVLIPFGLNFGGGTSPDTMILVAYPGDPSNPGFPLGSAAFANGLVQLAQVDTNSVNPVFTYSKFETSGDLSNNFHIFLQTLNFNATESDLIAIFANAQGDGQGEARAMIIAYNGSTQQFYFARYADLQLQMGDGNPPNFDVLILPVITPLTSVEDPVTMNGLTLNPIHPNPVQNKATVDFSNEKAGNIKLNIVDMNGYLIKSLADGQFESGKHSLSFDASGIPSGSYLLTIQSASSSFAMKINIIK